MVIDVTEDTFATEVLARSSTVPVVVDFWAPWCGPCRQLGPALEASANAREGKVVLAKLDTDQNPRLAAEFQIQGIPAVKAFKDGRVVEEFTGALPPAAVERFFDGLVPSEVDGLVDVGDEASLRRALELEPGRADAAVPLARLLLARDEDDAAPSLLADVHESFQADAILARLDLERDLPELAATLATLDDGADEVVLDTLIGAIAANPDHRDALRKVVVGELDRLGVESPIAREYRRRLANALY